MPSLRTWVDMPSFKIQGMQRSADTFHETKMFLYFSFPVLFVKYVSVCLCHQLLYATLTLMWDRGTVCPAAGACRDDCGADRISKQLAITCHVWPWFWTLWTFWTAFIFWNLQNKYEQHSTTIQELEVWGQVREHQASKHDIHDSIESMYIINLI